MTNLRNNRQLIYKKISLNCSYWEDRKIHLQWTVNPNNTEWTLACIVVQWPHKMLWCFLSAFNLIKKIGLFVQKYFFIYKITSKRQNWMLSQETNLLLDKFQMSHITPWLQPFQIIEYFKLKSIFDVHLFIYSLCKQCIELDNVQSPSHYSKIICFRVIQTPQHRLSLYFTIMTGWMQIMS